MTVGYGAAHRVTRRGRVATVPVGYADGYPRALGGAGQRGPRRRPADIPLPVIGRVSMDLIALDVSALPEDAAHIGAAVELIGPKPPLWTISRRSPGPSATRYSPASGGARRAITPAKRREPFRGGGPGRHRLRGRRGGGVTMFAGEGLSHCVRPPFHFRLVARQMIDIGYYSCLSSA